MPIYETKNRKVLFVHIPKTGGTSVTDWLDSFSNVYFSYPSVPPGLRCPPQHLEADTLLAILNMSDFSTIFSFVRHPEDRLKSQFEYGFQKSSYNQLIKKFPCFLRPVILEIYWTYWVYRSFARCKKDPFYLSNHIRPQSDFDTGDGHVFFKLEDGIGQLSAIMETDVFSTIVSGYEPKLNTSKPLFVPTRKFIRKKIESFYLEDYIQFGYRSRLG